MHANYKKRSINDWNSSHSHEIKLITGGNGTNYEIFKTVQVNKGPFHLIRWQLWNRLDVECRSWRLNNLSVSTQVHFCF